MHKYVVRTVAIALSCFFAASQAGAAVKLIGDFEGNFASPYTVDYEIDGNCGQAPGAVNWCVDTGITVAPEFISIHDEDYVGGVTHGEQALLFTFPPEWGSQADPYLRLHGQEQLMGDTADYPYLLFDVTTFGPAVDPSTAPEGQGPYRQVHTNFNIPNLFPPPDSTFYDYNFDHDIQEDFDIADFEEPFSTATVVLDMTGTAPVHDDGKNVMNATADFYRTEHNDGTPIPSFVWQFVWVFQGRDYPAQSQIQVVIDNVRFCDDSLEVCLAPPPAGVLGDFNDDGNVNAADYVTFRKFEGTMTELPNDGSLTGTVGSAHYELWRAHFGESAAGGGALAAVPEPASVVIMLCGLTALSLGRRARN